MKKLLVLSLSLLSLTFNAWPWGKKNKKVTKSEEIEMTVMASIPPIEPTTKETQAAKKGLVQRFKESKYVAGGEKTKAVGRAIASPFKAVGNSYRTLKNKYAPRTYKEIEESIPEWRYFTYRATDVKNGQNTKEKAKIVLTKGVFGAAAPFHAAGKAIGNAAGSIKTKLQTAWKNRRNNQKANSTEYNPYEPKFEHKQLPVSSEL